MITSEQFFQHLRSALNHLYDPYFLRKSPLVKVFGLGDQPDAVVSLQRILNDGIARLAPRPGDSQQAQRRKNYELIMYRYVQQFSQEEVANQLGLSVRHLRREQNAAIYALAAELWEQYQLDTRPFEMAEAAEQETEDEEGPPAYMPETSAPESLPEEDLRWLKEARIETPANLEQVLAGVLELAGPLAERYQVAVEVGPLPALPGLAVQEVALRQLLLNILSVALRVQDGGRLLLAAGSRPPHVEIRLRAAPERPGEQPGKCRPLGEDEHASLHYAARIAELYGGGLRCSFDPGPCSAEVLLPAYRRRTLLVIDDNLDFFQLVERSLTGTRFTAINERSPYQAVEAAARHAPDVILLDVMMPGLDGWEVLGRLRRHPATAHIPVIICTILPQEELAVSLGASDFLRKPVTQEQILAALDRQLAFLEKESRWPPGCRPAARASTARPCAPPSAIRSQSARPAGLWTR